MKLQLALSSLLTSQIGVVAAGLVRPVDPAFGNDEPTPADCHFDTADLPKTCVADGDELKTLLEDTTTTNIKLCKAKSPYILSGRVVVSSDKMIGCGFGGGCVVQSPDDATDDTEFGVRTDGAAITFNGCDLSFQVR